MSTVVALGGAPGRVGAWSVRAGLVQAPRPSRQVPIRPPGNGEQRGTLTGVSFRPDALRGAPAVGPDRGGQVSYRLARNAVVSQFQKGRLSRLDVCDAHPELLRAARNVGEATAELCPICEETNVVIVSYVFGSGLASSGHCVTTRAELAKLKRRGSDLACYVVEVCPGCSWNHLANTFLLGGRRRASS